jgi:hypothetical protein
MNTAPEPLTPAAEIRAAVTALRCDHRNPMQPPHGLDRPGDCAHCGTPWRYGPIVADDLREPLADLLTEAAACGCEEGDDHWPQTRAALATARAITGRTP